MSNIINSGDLYQKPGWVRLSIHPMMTDEEAHFIADAVMQVARNIKNWQNDYSYDTCLNEFKNIYLPVQDNIIKEWFKF